VSELIVIVLPGKPRGKQRPFFTKKGFGFTPKQTRVQEATVKTLAIEAMAGRTPFDGPVALDIVATMEIPRSWSKKKQELARTGGMRPTGKPDADNLLKLVADSCNGICYRDDAQIVWARITKVYGEHPQTRCEISELALARTLAVAA
jgi:Holliday junction resolvase RusA-like endonuclease